jgi:hypothetical protein
MSKKSILWLCLLGLMITFIVVEWKYCGILLCLFLVGSILVEEIKGIARGSND